MNALILRRPVSWMLLTSLITTSSIVPMAFAEAKKPVAPKAAVADAPEVDAENKDDLASPFDKPLPKDKSSRRVIQVGQVAGGAVEGYLGYKVIKGSLKSSEEIATERAIADRNAARTAVDGYGHPRTASASTHEVVGAEIERISEAQKQAVLAAGTAQRWMGFYKWMEKSKIPMPASVRQVAAARAKAAAIELSKFNNLAAKNGKLTEVLWKQVEANTKARAAFTASEVQAEVTAALGTTGTVSPTLDTLRTREANATVMAAEIEKANIAAPAKSIKAIGRGVATLAGAVLIGEAMYRFYKIYNDQNPTVSPIGSAALYGVQKMTSLVGSSKALKNSENKVECPPGGCKPPGEGKAEPTTDSDPSTPTGDSGAPQNKAGGFMTPEQAAKIFNKQLGKTGQQSGTGKAAEADPADKGWELSFPTQPAPGKAPGVVKAPAGSAQQQ